MGHTGRGDDQSPGTGVLLLIANREPAVSLENEIDFIPGINTDPSPQLLAARKMDSKFNVFETVKIKKLYAYTTFEQMAATTTEDRHWFYSYLRNKFFDHCKLINVLNT